MATLGLIMFFCLEFLIFLSFTRCFANEIQWVMEYAHKQRKYRQHKYLPIIDASSHVASARPISTEFWWTHDVQEFNNSQSKYKLSMLSPWLSKQESWQPLKAEFPFPPEFALNTERRKCHSNTQNHQGTFLHLFLNSYQIPVSASHLC